MLRLMRRAHFPSFVLAVIGMEDLVFYEDAIVHEVGFLTTSVQSMKMCDTLHKAIAMRKRNITCEFQRKLGLFGSNFEKLDLLDFTKMPVRTFNYSHPKVRKRRLMCRGPFSKFCIGTVDLAF